MTAPLQNKKVVVVEDELLIAMLVTDMLTELGCASVLAAYDLPTATAMLAKEKPDLAILDLKLNGILSYPVAEMLAAGKVPIIFSTGYNADAIEKAWQHCPALPKPYTMDHLRAAVTKALDGSQ